MTENVFFFFFFFSFMCHECVLSLICLFIISGGFELSVKKGILWKNRIQSLKTADAAHSCEIMADATILGPPSPELGATLFSNKCWTLHSQRTSKCKNNNTISLYRETFLGRHTGTTKAVSCAIFVMILDLSSSYMYILYVPLMQKCFFGNGRPGLFQTSLVSHKI